MTYFDFARVRARALLRWRLPRLTPLAPAPSQAAAKIQRLVSPGGIEAWFVQDATVPLIAMEYAFGGGAAQDPAGKPGVGNMVAGLLDEGSGELDSKTFHERLDRRAIELSFSSTRDYLRGSLAHAEGQQGRGLRPVADGADLAAFRQRRRRAHSRPGRCRGCAATPPIRRALAGRKFLEVAFGDHPYGRQANGTLESVPKIDVADLKDYVRRVLAKDTLRIAVVGDVDPATLGKLLDKTFGGLPAKASLTPVADVEAAKPPQRAFIPLDVPQTVVTFGGPGIKRHDPDFMAGYVVNHILGGGGLSSRLYREVREKRGLAYSVYESLLWMDHSALFIGNTGTRADRAGETVDAIEKEIRRMAEEGPTQQELDEAKSYLKGSQMLALDTSSKLASALLQYQLDKLPIDYIEKRNAIVDAVTLDDAKKAAKRLWGQGLLTVIVGRAPQAAAQPAATAADGELSAFQASRQPPTSWPRTSRASRRMCSAHPSGSQSSHRAPSIAREIPSGDAMLRISRDLSIDENDIEIALRPRLRPGRAERQQALDRRPIAFRHAPGHAAGRRRVAAQSAGRPAHDQGRRDRDSRPALPHPGAQPRRRHRPAARNLARGHGAACSAPRHQADIRIEAAPARRQEAPQRRQGQARLARVSTIEYRTEAVVHAKKLRPPRDRSSALAQRTCRKALVALAAGRGIARARRVPFGARRCRRPRCLWCRSWR